MNADDFFKQIDQDLQEKQQQDKVKQVQTEQQKAKVKNFVQEVVPHIEQYKKQLEQRQVHVDLSHSTTALSFNMYYSDNGHHGFHITENHKFNYFFIETTYTSDDGRDFVSEGAVFEPGKEWSWIGFKKYFEGQIQDFFFYADRHGGYVSKIK